MGLETSKSYSESKKKRVSLKTVSEVTFFELQIFEALEAIAYNPDNTTDIARADTRSRNQMEKKICKVFKSTNKIKEM